MRKANIFFCIFLAVFAALYGLSSLQVRRAREKLNFSYSSQAVLLPTWALQVLAGEFKGLISDYLLLEAGSFIGANQDTTEADWRNLEVTLRQALDLDPYGQQTYIYVQSNLPWNGLVEEGNALLDISREKRPWDWWPANYMGFNYYYFLGDFDKASEAFRQAAKVKNSPAIYALLASRFASKSLRTESAITLVQNMLAELAGDEESALLENKKKELTLRLEALGGVLALEKAIEQYKKQHGFLPSTLTALVEAEIIPALPENPYKVDYYYDNLSGEVAYDSLHRKITTEAASIALDDYTEELAKLLADLLYINYLSLPADYRTAGLFPAD